MCYYVDTSLTKEAIKEVYGVGFEGKEYKPTKFLNGFSHALVPVILDENPDVCTTANWGLIPSWSKDRKIQKQTLNAKIETIKEKPSFRNNYNKRCLVLVNGFYEWKWLDDRGKEKHKHFLSRIRIIGVEFRCTCATNHFILRIILGESTTKKYRCADGGTDTKMNKNNLKTQ